MTPLARPRREFWAAQGENLRIALDALRANKLRSVLTVIGNVVAVMSVIAVVAVIDGMNTYVSEKVLEQGLKVIYIDKFGLITNEDEWRDAMKRRDLTLLDAEALKGQSRLASEVVAQLETTKRVRAGRVELQNVRILGTTEGYEAVGTYEIDQGRPLEDEEIAKRRPVCLLGSELAQQLFPVVDPIGQAVRVAGYELRVAGTVAARGNVLGRSQDNFVLIPFGQFQKIFGPHESVLILMRSRPGADFERVQDEARVILRSRRHVPIGKPDDFAITTSETYMSLYESLTKGIYAGTIGLVAISLLVGGIVIMNIMLVAVTERTREIGIRKALGARQGDLLSQFLSETVVLSFFGGLIGVLVGVAIALLIRIATPLPASIQPWSVAISLIVASSVGLFFGVYPATRAAKLDPIVALRQE
ncbi:MAG: FtsX-like permease family protein [Candidatus Eisenbacteria bacterium]|uniref:FtsX-like permease family protein n=1 Tax=Eiseniibacteriota bacterium TaxID=2212470 RepID=A0A538SP78_UNCEI|nr:MAG: FtsX-like permease family protein [Candidatus Eisenbacteria bacterium]TMQ62274.1 MAG: FtsX-like permease family protein [Candidatus Eisenbacteria bacterium]